MRIAGVVSRLSGFQDKGNVPVSFYQMMETDEIIYDRFLSERSEEDLRILLERHKETLMFFLYGYVHNMDDAEELMLDSFAETAAGRTLFSGRSSFKTWLFAVARNKARMFLRKQRPVTISLDQLPEAADMTDDPENSFLQEERDVQLHRAMMKLDPEAQHALHLIYFEDMSYDELAQVLGKSRKQTYRLADRYRKQLKKILESEGYYEDNG